MSKRSDKWRHFRPTWWHIIGQSWCIKDRCMMAYCPLHLHICKHKSSNFETVCSSGFEKLFLTNSPTLDTCKRIANELPHTKLFLQSIAQSAKRCQIALFTYYIHDRRLWDTLPIGVGQKLRLSGIFVESHIINWTQIHDQLIPM